MFKKLILPIVAIFFFCYFWQVNSKPIFSEYGDYFEVYSSQKSSGEIKFANLDDFFGNFFKAGEAVFVKDLNDQSEGEFITKVLNKFDAEVVFVQSTNLGKSVYAYSDQIKYLELVKGQRVNLHIFIAKEGGATIGSPLIYGSF